MDKKANNLKITLYKSLYWASGANEKQSEKLFKARWIKFIHTNGKTYWKTSQKRRVVSFSASCVGKARKEIKSYLKQKITAVEASIAEDSKLEIPVPDSLEYLPFQKAGISYCLDRQSTLIADSMGLGKTIQAIGVANIDKPKQTLIICPASLKKNWENEWKKWYCHGGDTSIVNANEWEHASTIIINPDILERHISKIHALKIDMLIIDEIQYYTNGETARTKSVFGYRGRKKGYKIPPITATRRIALSGTPIRTKPHDLWVLCREFDPNGLGSNYWNFRRKYCGGVEFEGDFLQKNGASNLDILQEKLRKSFMVRRDKYSVLKELPGKRRQIIECPNTGVSQLMKREETAIEQAFGDLEKLIGGNDTTELNIEKIQQGFVEVEGDDYAEMGEKLITVDIPFESISVIRQELALAKVPHVIDFVDKILAEDEKVVIFVYHKSVAKLLKEYYTNAAVIVGSTPLKKRQPEVDRFQEDPDCRVLIGNFIAAGVGFTMTIASKVVFAELSWVASELEQAEDRLERIGQKNFVMVYHLVFENSLDSRMVQKLIMVMENTTQALDDKLVANLKELKGKLDE